MQITDVTVQWNEDVLNDPKLILHVDDVPSRDNLRFKGSKEEGLWYGEHDSGYVRFYAWDGGQQSGYCGRHITITTVDGNEVTLKGPWSSRAGVLNKHGYGPCLTVTYRVNGGPKAGAITLDAAQQAVADHLDGVELARITKYDDEPYYIPQRTATAAASR